MDKPQKQDLSPISRRAFFGKMAGRAAAAGAAGLAASQLVGCRLTYSNAVIYSNAYLDATYADTYMNTVVYIDTYLNAVYSDGGR